MKKITFLIIFCIFAALSCKTQNEMGNFKEVIDKIPIFENQTQLTEETYFVCFNQLIYADNKPYRNIGDMKITFLNNRIILHQINFLFLTPFDIELNNKMKSELKKEALEDIVSYISEYSIDIGSPIYVNIAKQ